MGEIALVIGEKRVHEREIGAHGGFDEIGHAVDLDLALASSTTVPTPVGVKADKHPRREAKRRRTLGQCCPALSGACKIFKMKILLSIASLLVFVAASAAAEFTYQDYAKAPEAWKRGFLFGISRYMSTVAQPDEEPPYPVRTAFERCLGSSTDALLVHQVEAYVAANPANAKGSMVAVVLRAFFNLCRADIERASPKGAPGPR